MLPTRNGQTFGRDKVVVDFMRGVFNLRPPKPKYAEIWDPDEVLEVLKRWTPCESIRCRYTNFPKKLFAYFC